MKFSSECTYSNPIDRTCKHPKKVNSTPVCHKEICPESFDFIFEYDEGLYLDDGLVFSVCPECGVEQQDIGHHASCDECGHRPMPTTEKGW